MRSRRFDAPSSFVYVVILAAPKQPHGIATAAANAPACAIWAMATRFFQTLLPITDRSGTTIVSPGPMAEDSTPPDHMPLVPLVTDPLARIMKMAFLLARLVAPPARERYQAVFFPGV